jgi:hypothetical protein
MSIGFVLALIISAAALWSTINVFRSMLYDSTNPSLVNVSRVGAALAAGVLFSVIAVFPAIQMSSSTSGPSIGSLIWPLGIGVIERGSFVKVEDEKDANLVLLLGLEGETIAINDGQIEINGQALVAATANIPAIACTLDVRLPSESFLIVERVLSSWVHGKELTCAHFVVMNSRRNVRSHVFFVFWPWELFGVSRIDLRLP